MKIAIAVCSGDMVHAPFMQSLALMMAECVANGIEIALSNIRASEICYGRYIAAHTALQLDCSHLLFIDSDMKFPNTALRRLFGHNKSVVGITYCQRRSPRGFTHVSLNGDQSLLPFDYNNPLIEVQSLGCGLLLIEMNVLRELEPPYFWPVFHVDKKLPDGSHGHTSEDVAFCEAVRTQGFRIWCDGPLSLECRHCGTFEFGPEHVEILRNSTFFGT